MYAIRSYYVPLGAGLSLQTILQAGLPGVVLGLMTLILTGVPTYFIFKWLVPRKSRRTAAVGAAVGTSAGNSIATPAAIALVDPNWAPYARNNFV